MGTRVWLLKAAGQANNGLRQSHVGHSGAYGAAAAHPSRRPRPPFPVGPSSLSLSARQAGKLAALKMAADLKSWRRSCSSEGQEDGLKAGQARSGPPRRALGVVRKGATDALPRS